MLQQISIFTANQKGALSKITAILEKNNINIYTMLATDSANSVSYASSRTTLKNQRKR